MAVSVLDAVPLDGRLSEDERTRLYETVLTALKLTWNTRGAADLARIRGELKAMMGEAPAAGIIMALDHALSSLDRP